MRASLPRIAPRLLDLFCGGGGAAMGYHLAGFQITGVDHVSQPRYPFPFVCADALEYLAAHAREYDVIHASPPCQRYSRETPQAFKANHSDLLEQIAPLLRQHGQPYIIENVEDARHHLRDPLMLCGSMFGLPIWRHRRFEIAPIFAYLLPACDHSAVPVLISGTQKRKGYKNKEYSVAARREAIQCPWMADTDLDQAIPPAYTKFIGEQIRKRLGI